jgi:hypothetical protein
LHSNERKYRHLFYSRNSPRHRRIHLPPHCFCFAFRHFVVPKVMQFSLEQEECPYCGFAGAHAAATELVACDECHRLRGHKHCIVLSNNAVLSAPASDRTMLCQHCFKGKPGVYLLEPNSSFRFLPICSSADYRCSAGEWAWDESNNANAFQLQNRYIAGASNAVAEAVRWLHRAVLRRAKYQ